MKNIRKILDGHGISYRVMNENILVLECLYHKEKTGSLLMDEGQDKFRCFSCGASGKGKDLIEKVMQDIK